MTKKPSGDLPARWEKQNEQEVINMRLIEFIKLAKSSNVDFAKITYSCSAYEFVDQAVDFSFDDESIRTYTFKDFYTDWSHVEFMSYHVMAILKKSYLMYELKEEITIWICYTEEKHRGKGYMAMLLDLLKNKHPGIRIIVDTYNDGLRKICQKLGINLFR